MDWLDMVTFFCCCVIEVFLLYDYFNNFFEKRMKERNVTIAGVGAVFAVYLINMLQNSLINLIVVPIILWLFITMVFDSLLKIRIMYFVMAYIVMIGAEFLYGVLIDATTEMLADTGLVPVSEYLWQLLFVKLLNYIIFLILKQTSAKSSKRMTGKLFIAYLCVPLSTLGIMLTVFYSGIDIGANTFIRILMTLFFIFMLMGDMILFYAFQKYSENLNENAEQQIEIFHQKSEVERLRKISQMNDDYNMVMHDISHYLKVIDELAHENRINEICQIVEKLNGTLNNDKIYEYSNHKMLNALLSEYAQKSYRANILFDAYVEPGCLLNQIDDADLIVMLGNLLDNAITAASKRENDAAISVRIFMQKNGRLCILKVTNDFNGKLKQIGGKLASTKSTAGLHGIGLTSVSKTAKRYDGYLEHYVADNKFVAVIVLSIQPVQQVGIVL